MTTLTPMRQIQKITGQDDHRKAKKAFAKMLSSRKIGDASTLAKISNLKMLRLARRHARDLLGEEG